MSNEVEIHVKVTDDGKASLDKTKATYTAAGKDIGTSTGKAIDDGVKKTQFTPAKIKADNPIDEAWRSAIESSLKTAVKDSLQIPLTPESEQFRRDLAGTIKQVQAGLKMEIPADVADAAQFKEEVQLLAYAVSKGVKAEIPVEVDEKTLNDATEEVDEKVKKVAKDVGGSFNPLLFAGLAVGLPAAAAIGAAGAGLAISAVPLLFGGIAVAALKSNEDVKGAFTDMATSVKTQTQSMAAPLTGTLVTAIGQVGTTFDSLAPTISRTMLDSRGPILQLTSAVTDFASNAMPGMLIAVDSSKGPLEGLRTLSAQTGAGLTDMFSNLAAGSQGAEQGMEDFGSIVRNLEGFLGTLLANLANGSHAILPQFSGALSQVENIIGTLTSGGGGMPALQGAASGFLGTISGGLAIVQGLASGLGSWAGPLGQATGALGATNSIAKIFGTSLSSTGLGIGAFATSIDDAGKKTTPFKSAIEGATGVGSKLSAGLGSIASSGFNPLGVALVGGGLLLDLWGQHAQEAAARAAANKQVVEDLTQAYIKDGQAIGANVQASVAKQAADGNLANNAAAAGISQETWTAAITGDTAARKLAIQTTLDHGKAIIFAGQGSEASKQAMYDDYVQIVQNGGSINDLTKAYDANRMHVDQLTASQKLGLQANGNAGQVINQLATDLDKAAQSSVDLTSAQDKVSSQVSRATTPAMYAAGVAAGELTGAFTSLNTAGGDVVSKGQALITVLRTLAGEKPSVEDALNSWNTDLRAIDTTLKGDALKGHTKDLIDNTGAVNTATKAGGDLYAVVTKQANDFAAYGQSLKDSGASAEQMTTKLGGMRDSFIDQMKAMGLSATEAGVLADHYGLIPGSVVTQLSLEGDKETQAQLTDITTKLAALPPGKSIAVDALTDPAIQALGSLGDTVVRLPNGKFQVFADTAPGKAAADALLHDVGTSNATATVYANTVPALQAVVNWQQSTTKTVGNTTTTTDTNPATGKVRTWVTTTDGTGAQTTTYTNADPAAGAVGVWKRNTDGTWAQVNVNADTGAANAAIDYAARNRTANIYLSMSTSAVNAKLNSLDQRGGNAQGGLITTAGTRRFAAGGLASGGALNVGPGGLLSGPGTGISDDIYARLSNKEFVVNAAATSRNLPLLHAINNGATPTSGSASISGSAGASGGGGGGGSASVVINFGLTGTSYVDAIITDIAKSVRAKGGNVQVVLGGSS